MSESPEPPAAKPEQCEECGKLDIMEIAGRMLCADCVVDLGCGCGGDSNGEAGGAT
jgi:hypothetical protein